MGLEHAFLGCPIGRISVCDPRGLRAAFQRRRALRELAPGARHLWDLGSNPLAGASQDPYAGISVPAVGGSCVLAGQPTPGFGGCAFLADLGRAKERTALRGTDAGRGQRSVSTGTEEHV